MPEGPAKNIAITAAAVAAEWEEEEGWTDDFIVIREAEVVHEICRL